MTELNRAATMIQKVERGHQQRLKTSIILSQVPHVLYVNVEVYKLKSSLFPNLQYLNM